MALEDDTKITVRISPDLKRRLKITQAYDGRSIQQLMNEMIEAWVRSKESERDKERV